MSLESFRPLVEIDDTPSESEKAYDMLLRDVKDRLKATPEEVLSSLRDKYPITSVSDERLSPAEAENMRLSKEEYDLTNSLRSATGRRTSEQSAAYRDALPGAVDARIAEYGDAHRDSELTESERAAILAEHEFVLRLGLLIVESAKQNGQAFESDTMKIVRQAIPPRISGSWYGMSNQEEE